MATYFLQLGSSGWNPVAPWLSTSIPNLVAWTGTVFEGDVVAFQTAGNIDDPKVTVAPCPSPGLFVTDTSRGLSISNLITTYVVAQGASAYQKYTLCYTGKKEYKLEVRVNTVTIDTTQKLTRCSPTQVVVAPKAKIYFSADVSTNIAVSRDDKPSPDLFGSASIEVNKDSITGHEVKASKGRFVAQSSPSEGTGEQHDPHRIPDTGGTTIKIDVGSTGLGTILPVMDPLITDR